ncbi:hypothetical protein ACFL6E_02535 [Candidatus Neomarinimicrobiota bacterium]
MHTYPKSKLVWPIVATIWLAALSGCDLLFPPDDPPIECPHGYYLCGEDSTDCCIDTTSHSFVWEIDTLGNTTISSLTGAFMVDENDIWVVGTISLDEIDSLTGVQVQFNAAHWDGTNWELVRQLFASYIQDSGAFGMIHAVYGFAHDDIWLFSSFGSYAYWNGERWTSEYVPERRGSVRAIWGNSSRDIYFVGSEGNITHYDGNTFQFMESGTRLRLWDVSGRDDHVFAVGHSEGQESIALELRAGVWNTLYFSPTYFSDPDTMNFGRFNAVDVWGDTAYFATNAGLVKYNYLDRSTVHVTETRSDLLNAVPSQMMVSAPNDIMVVGLGANILHFNGADWFSDDRIIDELGWGDVFLKAGYYVGTNLVFAGRAGGGRRAVVVRGTRLPWR